jgi:glucose-1-phosphate thymidylyltransferase
MKAVILAAGEGRRLKPLTDVRPKPMLPVANRPLLDHVVTAVAEAGVTEVVIVVGYKRERIQNYFGDGDDWGVSIEYAVQETQLGTGHAVLQAEPHVDGSFVALNGDRVIEPSLVRSLVDAHDEDVATLAVTRSNQPSDYGVVELDGDEVTQIVEKPPEYDTPTELINAGVYAFGPEIFDEIRRTDTSGELAITDALDRLASDHRLDAVRYRGLWLDVSHFWDLLTVNSQVLDRTSADRLDRGRVDDTAVVGNSVSVGADARVRPHATVLRGTALGDNVEIGPSAVVSNSVVLSDARIGAGAVLHDCIVGENAVVGPNTTVEGGEAALVIEGTYHEDVKFGGLVGDNARVGGNVTVAPGSVLGNQSSVGGGSAISGRIPSGTEVRRG